MNSSEWIMKSAYGFNTDVSCYIKTTITNTSTGAVSTNNYTSLTACAFATNAQTAYTYFPEFNYSTYYRQLDNAGFSGDFRFKENIYSSYKDRSHFTPIWLSDRVSDYSYNIIAKVTRAYTPMGELSLYGTSNTIRLQGNVYDDWIVVPVR